MAYLNVALVPETFTPFKDRFSPEICFYMGRGSHFYINCLAIRFSGPYSELIMKTGISSSFSLEVQVLIIFAICATFRYYAAQNGRGLTGLSEQPVSSVFRGQTVQDGTDGSSRVVGTKLPFDAV